MRIIRCFLLLFLISGYGYLFSLQEQRFQTRYPSLQAALPVNFYKITAGYLHQLVAEALFVRTSVFLGGKPKDLPNEKYSEPLASNFDTMTALYPRFIAPYYYL